MTEKTAMPPPKMSQDERVKKAIELLKQIKHQSVDIEGEGRKYKSRDWLSSATRSTSLAPTRSTPSMV